MTRLEKKCFIAASGTHGLLLVILLVGPAFLGAKAPVQSLQPINLIAGKVVDDALSSGGSAVPLPPPPTTQQQQEPNPPVPPVHNDPPKRDVTPEPPKNEPKPDKSLEPEPKPPKHVTKLTQDELKLVKPKNNTSQSNERQQREAAEQHQRDVANQQRIAAIKSSLRSLDGKFGQAVAIENPGHGGGGEAMTSYRDIVASKYTRLWVAPANLGDDASPVEVLVTISRDGRVVDSKITKTSNSPAMTKSIQNLLDIVTFIEPFPEGSKDQQITFPIRFNRKDRPGLG